jgi:hypothetical protein
MKYLLHLSINKIYFYLNKLYLKQDYIELSFLFSFQYIVYFVKCIYK